MDKCLQTQLTFHQLEGIFFYFYCAAVLCGSPWMLCCWHFWLVCLCFPQFLPGNSHGNSPAGKLCRHHELIVLLLLFRAVYPSGLRQVRNPQQLPQPWPGAPLVPPEQLLGSRGADAQPPLGRNWTDGLRTAFHTRSSRPAQHFQQ